MLIDHADDALPDWMRDALKAACAQLEETAKKVCPKEAFEHKEIISHSSVNSSKASAIHYRYGAMEQGGYGGGKVGSGTHSKKTRTPGRKFYKGTFNPDLGALAHTLAVLANRAEAHLAAPRAIAEGHTLVDKLFRRTAHFLLDNTEDWLRLAQYGGASVFCTLNFSHDRYFEEEDNVEEMTHSDPQDQSSTLLLLYQHPDTPLEHQVFWFDESSGTFVPVVGGIFLVFNGRLHTHGLIPPQVISMDPHHAWYGATLLMKHIPKGEKQPKVKRESIHGKKPRTKK